MAKSDQNAKQQIIEKLRDVDTVMVTVSASPSVDELSAALGVTLALNKLNKHATAVFSGEIPPAITFLDPEKTFENTVDSLRDFIIALDKEKADHLRYKVEGEMVKIYITPYRTTIDDKDLEFSQGDYNVEMVLAIGVRDNKDLDRALADHGRIMHDATVAGISIGKDSSDIGSISWHSDRASSYSELLADLVTSVRGDKNLLDEQIATALLTGIVAATDRFSNQHTSSEAMTISAQLMAAGANQQLIATKLEEAEEAEEQSDQGPGEDGSGGDKTDTNNDGSTTLSDDQPAKISRDKTPKSSEGLDAGREPEEPVKDRPAPDGTMTISHEKRGDVDEVAAQVAEERQEQAARHAEEILAESLEKSAPAAATAPGLSVADLQNDLKKAADEVSADAEQVGPQNQATASSGMSLPPPAVATSDMQAQPTIDETGPVADFIETPLPPPAVPTATSAPTFGGTLNATSEQAAADKRREEENDRNKTILSHDSPSYVASEPAGYPALNSFMQPEADQAPTSPVDGDSHLSETVSSRGHDLEPISPPEIPEALQAPSGPTLADLDSQHRTQNQSASDAMAAALTAANSTDQQQQQIPDIPALPPLPSMPQAADPSIGGMPPLPPLPDISGLPPLPPMQPPAAPEVSPQNQTPTQAPVQSPAPADPAQFQIPN